MSLIFGTNLEQSNFLRNNKGDAPMNNIIVAIYSLAKKPSLKSPLA